MASAAGCASGGVRPGALLGTASSVQGIWDATVTTAMMASLLATTLYAAAHAVALFKGIWLKYKPNLTA